MKISRTVLSCCCALFFGCGSGDLDDFDLAASRGALSHVIGNGTGLHGEYFTGTFDTSKVERTDATVNFDWASGAPGPGLGTDHFSVRWTGQLLAPATETFTFHTVSDDGVRLWVGGKLLIDRWNDHAATEDTARLALVAGRRYDVKLEFYENGGAAVAKLLWSSPSLARQVIPTTQLFPTAPYPTSVGALFHSDYPHAFVDANGRSVRMNGFNVKDGVIDLSATWTFSTAQYQPIHDAGFNALRFALKWRDFEGTAQGQFNAQAFALLKIAVARAKAAGLYVILDPIHLNGGGGNVPTWTSGTDSVDIVQHQAVGYLKKMAETFKDEPTVVAYDVVNEPWQKNLDQNRVLRMYADLIPQIRAIDPAKILILEPTWGDSSIAGSFADFSILPTKTNIIWSLHDYFAGCDDDGYNAHGVPAGCPVWDGKSGYPSPDAAAVRAHVLVTLEKLEEVRIPLFVGEYGIANGVVKHDLWLQHHQAVFNEFDLSRTYWAWNWTEMEAKNADYSLKPWVSLLK